jgi:hypothetical protein
MNNGDNIIQKIDYSKLSKEFVKYFYDNWMLNPNVFFQSNIFTNYTRLRVDDIIYDGVNIVKYLEYIWKCGNLKIEVINVNSLDSGSRRIDTIASGNIYKDNKIYIFSQYFLLIFIKDTWVLQNSILNINERKL